MTDLARPAGPVSLANPGRFLDLSGRMLPWLAVLAGLALAWGLYAAFRLAPADDQQGETVRIMFVHVPSAWLGTGIYVLMGASSLGVLVWRHPLADVAAAAAAPIGAAFTLVCLVTGALWGRPMWGAWWVWDARLTSMLVLFLMYVGVIALRHAIDEPSRAAKAAAILTLVGTVDVPVIRYSVVWWNTLHQPNSGAAMHPTILAPLLWMGLAFALVFAVLHLVAMRAELLRRRVRALRLRRADRGAAEVGA